MNFRLIGFILTGYFVVGIAVAQTAVPSQANAISIASTGGRIIGSAKSCGIDPVLISTASDKLVEAIRARSKTPAESTGALTLFVATQDVRIDVGRLPCPEAQAAIAGIAHQR